MIYIIAFNILLTILALFAILLLYVRQNRLMELEKKYDQLNQELEETMSTFLIQLKEENNRFMKDFESIHISRQSLEPNEQKLKEASLNELTPNNDLLNEEAIPKIKRPIARHTGIKAYENNQRIKDSANQLIEKSSERLEEHSNEAKRSEERKDKSHSETNQEIVEENLKISEHEAELKMIESLLLEGKTVDEIAKKLHKGKTEIELIIKFSPSLSTYRKE